MRILLFRRRFAASRNKGARRWLVRFGLPLALGLSLFSGLQASATNHLLRQDELMAGLNGDPTIQYLQMTVGGGDQKAWGPNGAAASRAMLVFFNGAGVETGRFFFPSNAPAGANTVLIATTNFANLPGAPAPDFLIPPLISPGSGKVCFRGNPANPLSFDVNLCLSYGTFPSSQTEGAGPPAPALPLSGQPASLERFQNFGLGQPTSQNADFRLASPSPQNTRGETLVFPVDGPEIEFVPGTLNFGQANINAGATALQTIVITNRGVVNPLIITNVTLTGTNANQFRLRNDTGQTTLPPGGTRTVTLEFDPDTAGTKTAVVRVISNDPDEVVSDAILSGFGVDPNAPEIFISPSSLNLGKQDITAGATVSQTVGIVNQGTVGSLVVSNITLAGIHANQFQILTPTNSSTLGPGASRVVSVAFDPDSAGSKTALLRIVSNDTDEGSFDVVLQGRAFDLNPCLAPNPTNIVAQNSCADAQLVCPGFVYQDTTSGATVDGSAACTVPRPDVWYRYLPVSNGTLTVTARAVSFNSPLSLSAHTQCPGTTANQLGCAISSPQIIINPPPGGGVESTANLAIPVTNGTEVFLRLAASASLASFFELTLEGPPCVEFDGNRNGITDSCELDFGDAPAPYPTTLAANGARHRAFTGIFLGKRIDPDLDGSPSTAASGDNLDGPPNDEDGVTLLSPLTVGQTSQASVFVSASGFLNAWIDFNADGDWSDAGEQVCVNQMLASGDNALAIDVPATASATNRTFARFRFSTATGLALFGESLDGEVEDYAFEVLPATRIPGDLRVRISEVMAGLNGDSTIQFVEIEAEGDLAWGPQGAETDGRAMLTFFDETGAQSGRFVFPSNAPSGGSVLIATRAFAEASGITPDFVMPPEIVPVAGKVVFRSNPDNQHFGTEVALSYGGNSYFGLTDGAGPANTNELPIMHAQSLTRAQPVPFGLNDNGAFELAAPTPRNAAGQTFSFAVAAIREQGRTLFNRETFRGNGRTCATCHVEGKDQFGLTPATIAALPEDDPLFVFAPNVDRLKLTARSRPGDLRGEVTGGGARGKILAGSGDTYLVIGGTNLAGMITDGNGNSGMVQSVNPGDLSGPTASNGSERGLEDHELLEHGRGLILENIDGFERGEVFRASPHLLDLAFTAPFGLSGEFGNLEDFSDGAVMQHFPKSLARVSGVDFRHPTRQELEAMTAFMLEISRPATNVLNLDRLATTEAQKRGRAMFFGDEGRCSKCHSGPVLALSDGSLTGSLKDFNDNFNTGVANLPINLPSTDDLPTEPAGLIPGQSTREFNTPSLFNIRLTAPFFHDGSALTLTDAVKFYDTEEFHNSPAGQEVGSLLAANKAEKIADMVAFLESLVELPVDFTRELAFGVHCPGDPAAGTLTATITNISTNTVTLTNVVINGTNAADFTITGDTGETSLPPGQTRSITVAFAPATMGIKTATLEIGALDTNLLGAFAFGVALSGADLDNVVQAIPTALDFGMRDIDAPPSPEDSIVITNDGSTELPIVLEVTGATNDFVLTVDPSPIPAHGTRVIQISFAPQTQGPKSAMIRIHMVSCSGTLIDILLAGTASSTVDHFAWDSIGATQFVGTPFPVRITARDRNGDTVESFRGTVRLTGFRAGQVFGMIVPTNSTPFVNGVWNGSITVQQPASAMRIEAEDSRNHSGSSAVFAAVLRDDLSLAVVGPAIADGEPLSYVLSVHNTGPTESTGVIISNRLSEHVTFRSSRASQGTVSHAGGLVICSLGTLGPGATASVTLNVEVIPPPNALTMTNMAVVTRSEPEAVLSNNVAFKLTLANPFSVLAVTPATNFHRAGFSGGPFTPTGQFYTISNAGTAALTWQARLSGCETPPGFVGWWPLDENANDVIGTNFGILVDNPVFTSGLVGSALRFDGFGDGVRVSRSPALDVGTAAGLTMEAWINPSDVSQQRPVIEYANESPIVIGPHLWISVTSGGLGGPGSVFANLSDQANVSHHIISPPNLVVANAWQHIAVTYNKATGTATLYLNGSTIAQQNVGTFTLRTTTDLFIGKRPTVTSFFGLIDEVGIANRELTEDEIRAIFNAGPSGKCVNESPVACTSLAGLTSWWPLDGTLVDAAGANSGLMFGTPVFTNGFVGQAMFFDGNNDAVRVPVSPTLNFANREGMTFEAWVNVPNINRRNPVFEFDDGTSFAGPFIFISADTPGSLHADLTDTSNTPHTVISGANLFGANTWTHIALTYHKENGRTTLYVNGNAVQQQILGSFTLRTTGNLFLGRRGAVGAEESFQGLIDEPAFYSRELTATEIRSVFLAGSAGKCRSRSWLSLSTLGGTLEAGSRTNVILSINTNGNRLAPGNYSETILFTNTTHRRGTTERMATLAVMNRPPTLATIAPIQMLEDSGVRTVSLAGIGAGGLEQQHLTISAISGSPAVIPDPIIVNYSSPATTGTLRFASATNAHGTSIVSVIVRDDGFIANGGRNAVTNTFQVIVSAVNDAPEIEPIFDPLVDEGTLLVLTNLATDVDSDQLTFSLAPPVPDGAVIEPSTGVLTWTPGEADGPSTRFITIVVQDNGSPVLRGTNQFIVTVLEVNATPVLAPIGDRIVHDGTTISFVLPATDPDIPANELLYALGAGEPPGATLNPTSGLFSWTARALSFPSTNVVTAIVSDNGVPIIEAARTFKIVVVARPRIESVSLSGTNLVIRWTAIAGVRYAVEVNTNLDEQGWVDLPGEVVASEAIATKSTDVDLLGRWFYRVRVIR